MSIKEKVFHADWFTGNIPNWERYLSHLKGVEAHALEIGCWEGRSTCWLLENILTQDASTISCIDTFLGNEENPVEGYEGDVKDNFFHNIVATDQADKVTLLEGYSQEVLRKFEASPIYDLIYIDGSHDPKDLLQDLVLSWPLLKRGGILIIDDYKYCVVEGEIRPAVAVEAFRAVFQREIIELHLDYQAIWRKM